MGALFSALVCACPSAFLSAVLPIPLGTFPWPEGQRDIASLPAEGWEVVGSQELVKAATGSGHNGCTDRRFGLHLSIPPRLPVHPFTSVCPPHHAGLQHPPA